MNRTYPSFWASRSVLAALLLLGLGFSVQGQDLTLSTANLAFGDVMTDAPQDMTITLTNPESFPVSVTEVLAFDAAFLPDQSTLVVPAGSTADLTVTFAPRQNLPYNSELIIATANGYGTGALRVDVQGRGIYPEAYYAPTQDLSQEDLKAALTTLISVSSSLGYTPARDQMYMVIDNWAVNGIGAAVNTLETVYTGRLVAGYIDRSDAQSSFNVNTEHTWPQSQFGSAEPMQSDLFHLYVTDAGANSTRGNLPFGNVTSPDWTDGGSKRGGGLFEPRDEQKGFTARSMLYFIIRHGNRGSFMTTAQENALRGWHESFPPDDREHKRNIDIEDLQGNRNPFIDHPELTERISSFVNTAVEPVLNSAAVAEDSVLFGAGYNGSDTYAVWVVADGNQDIVVNSATLSASPAIIVSIPDPVSAGEAGAIELDGAGSGSYTGTLSISLSSGETIDVPVIKGAAVNTGLSPAAENKARIWTNANGQVCLAWEQTANGSVTLYGMDGKLWTRQRVQASRGTCLQAMPGRTGWYLVDWLMDGVHQTSPIWLAPRQ